ncbi:MAG TPA: hypothetical protein VLD38_02895 [Nitrosopumilaceae archaeon]|nr:hypothetical protein [Nitrosopumilaceae archaeon]
MSEPYNATKQLGEKCPKCNHSKTNHMRNPRGEGREKGAKPVLGTCSECRKENKECKFYMS